VFTTEEEEQGTRASCCSSFLWSCRPKSAAYWPLYAG